MRERLKDKGSRWQGFKVSRVKERLKALKIKEIIVRSEGGGVKLKDKKRFAVCGTRAKGKEK